MIYTQYVLSPLGTLCLQATEEALFACKIAEENVPPALPNAITALAARQLEEYFSKTRTAFTVPLAFSMGTPFQQKVWKALLSIPFGESRTYGEVAAFIQAPKACRAVGQAVGKNPLLIFVPCHRVVAASGLGGFSCGLARKKLLRQLENSSAQKYFSQYL